MRTPDPFRLTRHRGANWFSVICPGSPTMILAGPPDRQSRCGAQKIPNTAYCRSYEDIPGPRKSILSVLTVKDFPLLNSLQVRLSIEGRQRITKGKPVQLIRSNLPATQCGT